MDWRARCVRANGGSTGLTKWYLTVDGDCSIGRAKETENQEEGEDHDGKKIESCGPRQRQSKTGNQLHVHHG
jgi:hypothetical protein